MFIKMGELLEISRVENTDSCVAAVSQEVLDNFSKFAHNLKRIAPRAEDFLYFTAVIIHAAEAAALNDDGSVKLNIKGEAVKVGWDKSGGTWRWETNDKNIRPYRNSNGDIFPEEELVKAYKKWVHKPLCIDHKSSSVDHTRGFIVDTYYDRILKRVIALCALDKANYPDLAKKVASMMQTSVSMGTAVGKAICTDCARVAKAEADFCDHMRRKTCYGEINIDLNPIELSIVVNGADPKAHIKQVIAAANTLNNYIENRSKELNKFADLVYQANLTVNDPKGEEGLLNKTVSVTGHDLEQFKKDVEDAMDKLKEIQSSEIISEKDTNDLTLNQSSGSIDMDETPQPSSDLALAPPHERYASSDINKEYINELREVYHTIEEKLSQMKQSLNKLSQTSTTKEENMSGSKDISKQGYYQGTEEPTPGQAKYPKDKLNEDLRLHDDKQMVGQMDTGPVDGMAPGPDSVGMSELERKKMLARAESEDRAIRRTAIVDLAKQALKDKTGYFQGTEEPTPGKAQYPKDKLNEQLRDREDKQMVGQKPFPNVGPVDGMHPSPSSADTSDEKKRKEMLQRASLRARFVKAANQDGTTNFGKSAWEVFQGDKLLLTASVDELTGNRSDYLYDVIATKDFGTRLIDRVKSQGATKVLSMVKSAQPAPAMEMPAAPAAPAPEAAAPEAPPADVGAPEDTGGSGDPKANVAELAEKVRDLSSDLVEGVRALTGEQAEMGDMSAPEMGAAASDTRNLNVFRKELNTSLVKAMKEAIADLNDHQQELETISGLYETGTVTPSNEEFVGSIAEDACNEAKASVADGFKVMTAFVRYSRGTKAIMKRAEIEAELQALAEGEPMSDDKDSHSSDDLMALISDTNADLDAVKDMMGDESDAAENVVFPTDTIHAKPPGSDTGSVDDDNDIQVKPEDLKDLVVKPGTEIEVKATDYTTKEGRAELRAKLAAETLKYSPMTGEAHPKGGFTTQLDVKPEGDLAKVEDTEEHQKAMMDVATAPPKVRKEAESIHRLVSEGQLDPADLDALIAEGLDKDAVAYYRKYYGQVDGGGEFASELVKEHVKAQIETEINKYKVKLARSYEAAYEMVDRGLCHNDRNAITAQVEEIMQCNEDGFETLKRVVAKHAPILRKEAGRMPQVGMIGSGDAQPTQSDDMFSQLSAAFSKTTKRTF